MREVYAINLKPRLRSRIANSVAALFLILSITSCATWENSPFTGDPETASIYFEDDEIIKDVYCNTPEILNYVCWHVDQIAELISLLKKHGIKRKEIKPIEKKIKELRHVKALYNMP